jgi:hypothetical protein
MSDEGTEMPTRGRSGGERKILKFVFGETLKQNTLMITSAASALKSRMAWQGQEHGHCRSRGE